MNADFNVSRDDPWNRAWLTSRELFVAYSNAARHGGVGIRDVSGGTVFEFNHGGNHWLQVWASPTEVIVAYPSFGELYGHPDETEVLHEFEEWINQLRTAEPLELGRARNRSSYGATCEPGATPALKWGQRGDWMFHYRNWPVLPEEWPTHCGDPQRMLNALPTPASERKRRLLAVAFGSRIEHLIMDDASRRVVEIAERYSDALATEAELLTASGIVNETAGFWHDEAGYRFWSDPNHEQIAWRAVRHVSESAYRNAQANTLSEQAATEVEYAAWAGEQAAQCDLVRDILGNPFVPVVFDPAWLTSDVVALARGIYEEKAFDRMPILADALQDAGCDSAEILSHCRGPGPHARGCWVQDLLLDRV